jgi:hypothetical protein
VSQVDDLLKFCIAHQVIYGFEREGSCVQVDLVHEVLHFNSEDELKLFVHGAIKYRPDLVQRLSFTQWASLANSQA